MKRLRFTVIPSISQAGERIRGKPHGLGEKVLGLGFRKPVCSIALDPFSFISPAPE
jgi:hypothetical protein